MKPVQRCIPMLAHACAIRSLGMVIATMLVGAASAATVIEARYDETTHGVFVITSNESIGFPNAQRVTDAHSKAIVEFDHAVELPLEEVDAESALRVDSTRGRAELHREDGAAAGTYGINYWLNAVGGTYAGTSTQVSDNIFPNADSCPVMFNTKKTGIEGKVLVERAADYSVHCRLKESGFRKFSMHGMVGIFELELPDPLKMPSGVYTGTIRAHPSSPGTLGLSDVPIRLVVRHSIKIEFLTKSVELKQYGGARGRSGPGAFRGFLDFSMTSVDPFKVYLACSNQIGDQCALIHNAIDAKQYPLTLHADIADSGQSRTLLNTKKQGAPVFTLHAEGSSSKGKMLFSLSEGVTREMTAGVYSSHITVIFDAVLD